MPAAIRASRQLEPVIHAVADHVHQRIVDVFHDLAIELGILAAEDSSTDLPERLLRSRTRRAIFWNVCRIGTMRIDIALRCSSLVIRLSCARLRVSRSSAMRAAQDLRGSATAG